MTCEELLACLATTGLLPKKVKPNGQIRVKDGVPQVSYNDGVTWQDVEGDIEAEPTTPASSAVGIVIV